MTDLTEGSEAALPQGMVSAEGAAQDYVDEVFGIRFTLSLPLLQMLQKAFTARDAQWAAALDEAHMECRSIAGKAAQYEEDREYNAELVRERDKTLAAMTKALDEARAAHAALIDDHARLKAAAEDFVAKCESGRAYSKDSYAKFKAALSPLAKEVQP